jgi:hypothetical protein
MVRRLKCASFLIDPKNNDTTFTLIGDKAKLTRWVDVEVTWCFYIGCLVLDISQFPIGQVDSVNHNAVMPPVRTIKKLPTWVHTYLST